MPEHLRTLVVILILSTAFFIFATRSATAIIGRDHFTRRRNLWFGLTLAAFLAHNFWLYTFIAIPLLLYANRHETNPPALFFFILFALPVATIQIPGLGLINYIFELSHARILALFILLPAFFVLLRQSDTHSSHGIGADGVLIAYLLLIVALSLRESNLTSTARLAFYLFIDTFLPYYVVSRFLKNVQAFKDALLSLVLAIMVLALIAVFEAAKHWLLYQPLLDVLGLEGMLAYLGRDGMLRAVASAGHSIALGYLMVVGIGCYLFLHQSIKSKVVRRMGIALLTAGLIAPLSRGPWVGAAVLLIVFIATGRKPAHRLMGLALAGMLALPLIAMLPGGERAINLLPFIGTTEKGSIDYREDLLTNSIIVIKRNPWFGSVNFEQTPEMEALRQGQGIIDVVNTYIGVALRQGLVGLVLFAGFFALVVIGVYQAKRSILDKEIGRAHV